MQEPQGGEEQDARKKRWIGIGTLGAFLVLIGGIVFENIIGNLGSNVFLWLWSLFLSSLRADYWPWIVTLLFLVLLVRVWWSNRSLNQALTTSTNLNELDDSLLRLLGSWDSANSDEYQVQRMLVELLRDATREFNGHVQRAFILLPDQTRGEEYLKVWAHTKLPQESADRMSFYVGHDEARQFNEKIGVAGDAFLSKKMCVAHMNVVAGKWQCDCEHYKSFAPRRQDPCYRSFVCMPIYGPHTNHSTGVKCLGVVCFDSMDKHVFDAPETEVILRVFTRRIATALLIYRLISVRVRIP